MMTKTEICYQEIARDIASGQIQPGAQLPSHRELQARFCISYITVLGFVRKLKDAGLVVARERSGLYVAASPPNLNRFVLLLTKRRAGNRFLQVLGRLMPEEATATGGELVIRRDFEPHIDNPAYLQTLEDARSRRIGAVAYISMPELPPDCELCNVPGLPILNLTKILSLDSDSFVQEAVDVLIRQGSSRIASLLMKRPNFSNRLMETLRLRGLPVKPQWFFPIGSDSIESASHAVRIMLDLPASQRPDGLIVSDDNLIEQALQGVYQSGVRVPDELRIVTHCNWPDVVACNIPVTRLGYDVQTIARHCISMLREACRNADNALWTPSSLSLKAVSMKDENPIHQKD
ncbi:MAG: substrate-binding domain-containing protein [Victivallales bacterium]|jgi:DNA-binding LacI/PurR family transcriptional regulator